MSHFSSIKVQIKNGEILEESLKELGYSVQKNIEVRGYRGDTTPAEYVIQQSNGYDIGFRKDGDERYEIIADFSMASVNRQTFANKINQKYAHKMLLHTVAEQGYDVESEAVMEDGSVRVVVGRWV
jgi:Protein of unknown function (DUF1257)